MFRSPGQCIQFLFWQQCSECERYCSKDILNRLESVMMKGRAISRPNRYQQRGWLTTWTDKGNSIIDRWCWRTSLGLDICVPWSKNPSRPWVGVVTFRKSKTTKWREKHKSGRSRSIFWISTGFQSAINLVLCDVVSESLAVWIMSGGGGVSYFSEVGF